MRNKFCLLLVVVFITFFLNPCFQLANASQSQTNPADSTILWKISFQQSADSVLAYYFKNKESESSADVLIGVVNPDQSARIVRVLGANAKEIWEKSYSRVSKIMRLTTTKDYDGDAYNDVVVVLRETGDTPKYYFKVISGKKGTELRSKNVELNNVLNTFEINKPLFPKIEPAVSAAADHFMKVNPISKEKVDSNYQLAFVLYSLEKLGLNDEQKYSQYMKYIKGQVDKMVGPNGQLLISKEALGSNNVLNGVPILAVYEQTKDQKYLKAAKDMADNYLAAIEKTKDGGTTHYQGSKQLWSNTMFMIGPFFGRLGKDSKEKKYFDEGAKQFLIHAKHLQDSKTGLMYHGWDQATNHVYKTYCARVNGWFLMGLIDFLEYLPGDHKDRQALKNILRKQISGLVRYQDPKSGLWYQVIDQPKNPKNWIETSGSSMFCYAILKAIQKRYIDSGSFSVVKEAAKGLQQKIEVKGDDVFIYDISAGTGLSDQIDLYFSRPKFTSDRHGYGSFLMAASQVASLKKIVEVNSLPSTVLVNRDINNDGMVEIVSIYPKEVTAEPVQREFYRLNNKDLEMNPRVKNIAEKAGDFFIKSNPAYLNKMMRDYPSALVLCGLEKLWLKTGKQQYFDYIKNQVDILLENGVLKRSVAINPAPHVNNVLIGVPILAMYEYTKEEKYLDAAKSIAKNQLWKLERNKKDRGITHYLKSHQLWADTMFMIGPFMGRMGKNTGDVTYFNEGAEQFIIHAAHLQNDETGLIHHAWEETANRSFIFHWGRANGWFAMALVEFLDYLPLDHPDRDELLTILKKQIKGLIQYQDAQSGLWYQLVDLQNDWRNWLESSSSSMFTYAIAKSVQKKYINKEDLAVAKDVANKGMRGLIEYQSKIGKTAFVISNVSEGTSLHEDINYYFNRGQKDNDRHGYGAFLMAISQIAY